MRADPISGDIAMNTEPAPQTLNRGVEDNPFAKQRAVLRAALYAAVSAQDIADVMQAMIGQARQGNLGAARLVLSYTLGRPGATAEKEQDTPEMRGLASPPPANKGSRQAAWDAPTPNGSNGEK